MINRDSFHVTPERSRFVRQEIADGSEPGVRFYVMVILSTGIAGFGLVMNSTAVIIGAMLVAPLMTPIFGIALALIRSDAQLLGRAVRAEIAGVVAAILMGFILGMVYPGLDPTPEMLARTQPQLFDLLVAIFSGFAGAYALVDEKISPALPGVAIATAIVPPLANTGLCFAVGAYAGGVGSFLLFFSNFLSILLVASVVFWFFRMTEHHNLNRQIIIRRFSLPILGFILIALILGHTLYQISRDRRIRNTVENILGDELADLPSASFDKMVYRVEGDKVHVFAHAYSAIIISPTQVGQMQKRLTEELKQPTELTIQSKFAQNVSGLDSYNQVTEINLDGRFYKKEPNISVLKTKIADSFIRNYLVDSVGGNLQSVQLLRVADRTVVLATFSGIFDPDNAAILELESLLRGQLEDPDLRLVIRFTKPIFYDRDGRFRFELTGTVDLTAEQRAFVDQVKTILFKWFELDPKHHIYGIDYTLIDDSFHFFLDTAGASVFPVSNVDALERLIAEKTSQMVNLSVLSKIEAVATSDGYESYGVYSNRIMEKLEPKILNDMKKIVRDSNL